MRLFYIAILVVESFLSSFVRCQVCADSSFHLRYTIHDRFDAHQQILLKDGGRLIEGGVDPLTGSILICRFDKYNNSVWSKKISASSPYFGVSINNIEETPNSNLAVCGFLKESATQYDFYIAFFNSAGNLLWQKVLEFPGIINFDERYKHNSLICKKGNDSLLFLFTIDWNSNDPQKAFLITTDSNGNIGSTKVVNLPGSSYSIVFIKSKVVENKLSLYGSAFHSNSCAYLNRTGAFINVEIDLKTNKVIKQSTYCLPTAGGTGFVGFSPNYHTPATYDIYSWMQNGFFLKNGGIALSRAYQRFTTIPDTTNWLFHISYFDSSFNPVKSEYVTTGNLFLNNTLQEVLIDSLQNKYFYFTDYNLKRTYYALADSANVLKLQKKVDIPSLETNVNENRLNIVSGDALFSITTSSVGNTGSEVDYFKILQKDVASQCFGTDTSFLSFKPAQLYAGTWGTITVQPAIYTEIPAGLSIQDYQITKEVVCVKRHVCDVLTLHTPNIVCDITQPVQVTATKNVDCEGQVVFKFDTSSVISYLQPNDTTLQLSFNKTWQGKIYASLSSCPSIKDSIQLNMLTQLSPLFLGHDTVVCKGSTLQLTPPTIFDQYTWQDGSTTKTFVVNSPGKYSLTATDLCGRQYSDTIAVVYSDCNNSFFVPSAFSPNNDGTNDFFKPIIKGAVVKYQFSIYNRWGEQVFTTKNINKGWDGKVKNREQTTAVYVWTCSYQFFNEQPKQATGTVLLIL